MKRLRPICFAVFIAWFATMELYAQLIRTNFLPIQSGTSQFALQYFSNRDPGVYSTNITQILITIHGISYNADDYLGYGVESMNRCPGASNNTLVIAPCLYITPFTTPATNSTIYWLSAPAFGSRKAAYGWPQTNAVNFSAYSALDVLSSNLLGSTNFPNLKRMVWFGNSGGGQLINRYAACSTQNVQAASRAIHTRYIVSAPSSYVYFNGERPVTNNPGQYFIPNLVDHPGYNDWGYGLSNLFEYQAVRGASGITNLYKQKFVVYCVGTLDNDPNDNSLDTGDEAELQGAQRLQRATNYFAYVRHFYGTNILKFQTFCLVTNVAHDARGILISDQGVRAVFDYETNAADSDGDRFSDWQEWLAGTDPNSAADRPLIASSKISGGNISLSWSAKESRRYRMLTASSLGGSWLTLTNVFSTNAVLMTNSFPATPQQNFFRLQIDPQ